MPRCTVSPNAEREIDSIVQFIYDTSGLDKKEAFYQSLIRVRDTLSLLPRASSQVCNDPIELRKIQLPKPFDHYVAFHVVNKDESTIITHIRHSHRKKPSKDFLAAQ